MRSRRVRRAIGATVAVAALTVGLSGCTFAWFVAVSVESDITCTTWTMTPHGSGTSTGGTAGDGLTYHPQVIDGSGTLLYSGPDYDVFTTDGVTPEVATYTTAPASNPIIAGIYGSDLAENFDSRAEYVGTCAGLPLAAGVSISPTGATPTSGLPSFDVRFSEMVTGFDLADLQLGGTSGPTGATLTRLSSSEVIANYGVPTDPIEVALISHAEFYRVTITGVSGDGTVTLSVPSGVVVGTSSETNAATSTAAATIDTSAPTLSPVADIVHQLTPGVASAAISWSTPTATDASAISHEQCTPASGSTFGIGDTAVTCSASDVLGHESSTAFTVHVLGAQTPVVHLAQSSPAAPAQGGTTTFSVAATDYAGTTGPLAASDYTVTSSVATDQIVTADGSFVVTFPHASPHILTVTQTSTGASTQLTVQVTPAAIVIPPAAGAPPAAAAVDDDDTALSATGTDAIGPLQTAAVLLIGGVGLLVMRGLRRRTDAR